MPGITGMEALGIFESAGGQVYVEYMDIKPCCIEPCCVSIQEPENYMVNTAYDSKEFQTSINIAKLII